MTSKISYRIVFGYVITWFVWIALLVVALHESINPSWILATCDAVISNIIVGFGGYAMASSMRMYQPSRKKAIYLLATTLTLALICVVATKWIITQIFPNETEYILFLQHTFLIRFLFSGLVITLIGVLSWVWYFFREQSEAQDRKADSEKLAREAELSKLRQQLQPHFLFNSLNSISALAGTKPEEARRMIQQLSDFLRGTLKKDDQQLVCLEEELQHLQLYLEIEKVRFGHRLNTEVIQTTETEQMALPSLLLQPIVENAIKFGLYDTIGVITIRIMAKVENNNLIIEVENPFDAETTNPRQGTGFGLSSVQRRLYLLYSRNDLLTTRQRENIFITEIKIPQTA